MKRLVLLGGGHAQIAVLADLAERPLPRWDIRLVTPYRRQIYSGMLPGWMAGHYTIERCAIALDTLAARAGVALHETAANALDPAANELRCADGTTLAFDHLSIDTGPVPPSDELPGSEEHALTVRPIERFVAAWPQVIDRIRSERRRFKLVFLGAGAGGLELALAVRHKANSEGWPHLHIALVGRDALPLDGAPDSLRRRAMAMLAQHGVAWHGERQASRIEPDRLLFSRGEPLTFDVCLVATGAAAAAWPAASGLATDEDGFIRVGATLQSLSHPHILAAGDAAAYHCPRPKSGVFAVRAGPVLAGNLRAICQGRSPRTWSPQRHALYLISTGDHHALATWGPWAWGGRWVWYWKDRIDQRFVRRYGTVG